MSPSENDRGKLTVNKVRVLTGGATPIPRVAIVNAKTVERGQTPIPKRPPPKKK
jgi:hypothetical protein